MQATLLKAQCRDSGASATHPQLSTSITGFAARVSCSAGSAPQVSGQTWSMAVIVLVPAAHRRTAWGRPEPSVATAVPATDIDDVRQAVTPWRGPE